MIVKKASGYCPTLFYAIAEVEDYASAGASAASSAGASVAAASAAAAASASALAAAISAFFLATASALASFFFSHSENSFHPFSCTEKDSKRLRTISSKVSLPSKASLFKKPSPNFVYLVSQRGIFTQDNILCPPLIVILISIDLTVLSRAENNL